MADVPAFRDAVLAYPIAVALHVLEEWPAFPAWARRFASPAYGDREYAVIHAIAVGVAVVTAAALRTHPAPWLVFGAFALALGPGLLWNAAFHAGASAWSGRRCPGVVTGLLVYVPYVLLLAVLVCREELLGLRALLAALALAALLHALEVGHNVFKRW